MAAVRPRLREKGKTRRSATGWVPSAEAPARRVNRAITRDYLGIYQRARIRPLPVRPVLVPVDPDRPDGPLHAATWQARYHDGVARPNRAGRRLAERKAAKAASA